MWVLFHASQNLGKLGMRTKPASESGKQLDGGHVDGALLRHDLDVNLVLGLSKGDPINSENGGPARANVARVDQSSTLKSEHADSGKMDKEIGRRTIANLRQPVWYRTRFEAETPPSNKP